MKPEIIDEFKNIYGPDKRFFVWALIIQPNHRECFYSPEHIFRSDKHNVPKKHLGDYGHQIARLVKLTEGMEYNICREREENYSDIARDIIRSVWLKK